MTIEGGGPAYEAYMSDFVKKSPWKWFRCKKCGEWVSMAKARIPCPLCPPEPKKDRSKSEDEEVFDPVTKSYVPKALFDG